MGSNAEFALSRALAENERLASELLQAWDRIRELEAVAQYSLRVGYGADDCGDHCGNGCHWCELRRAVAGGSK